LGPPTEPSRTASAALQDSFVSAMKELQGEAVNDLVSEAAKEIGLDSIAGVKTSVWKIGLESGRIAVKFFSWMDSLVSDTWLDYMWTDVGAYEADRLALYLSELQQNVYWVTCNELNRLSNNLSDPDAYGDYIYAQQLYCRTSIAMYENLMYMVDELGQNRDYWLRLFQDRIDMLAVSLYQLTTLQDDGLNRCLPLDLATFNNNAGEAISNEERYQAYAELIENYESQYGIANVHKMDEWFSYMTGLCFMKLVDFTQSGQEDLLLVYQTNVDNAWGVSREYTFEVWGYQGNGMVMLDSGELFGTDGGVKTVYLAEYDENIYLVTGGTDSFGYYYYHGYSNGEFGIIREAEWDWDEEYICSIDGIDVTYEEFETEQEKWLGNSIEYNLNYDCNAVLLLNEETKKALSPFYEGIDESTSDTEISVKDGTFEYQDGDLLSSFSALIGDGNYVGLAFWHNYGDSASDEDFIFEWEDGKWEYTVVGGRSGREFLIVFTPAESGMNIQVTCFDGTYYTWKTGEKAEEWVN